MVIRNNLLIAGPSTSSQAQIRLNSDSFPQIDGNTTQNRLIDDAGSDWSVSASGGQAAVDFPLLSTHGRLVPTGGQPQVVFAYGAGWVTVTRSPSTARFSPTARRQERESSTARRA